MNYPYILTLTITLNMINFGKKNWIQFVIITSSLLLPLAFSTPVTCLVFL